VERASWLCHPKVENLIRQFDTAGSAALWATLAEPAPAKLLGRPIFNSSAMDGTIGTGNDDILVMADMRAYVIVRRVPGMVIERVQHLFSTSNNRPTGQRGLYGWSRLGADLVDPDAARVLRV
jgi:HK97 family phage major capsid protein